MRRKKFLSKLLLVAVVGIISATPPVYSALNSWQYISRVLPGQPFGNGSDGAYSSATIPTMTSRSCSGSATSTTLTLGVAGFANGDLLLIYQTRGTGVGQWEINKVTSGGGTTSLTLQVALQYTYTDSGNSQAQCIKILQYTDVTVQAGTWTLPAWDGDTGGILVFASNGTATVTGTIASDGKGFRDGGGCGEGTAGPATNQETPNGSGGAGTYGDWFIGAGGGNGAAAVQSTHPTFPNNHLPGGLAAGSADLTTLSWGGGGGAGTVNGPGGGGGGSGGGLVVIIGKTVTINGGITSTGTNGNGATGQAGGCGGGAGGSTLIQCQSATLGNTIITALGGTGANSANGAIGRIAVHHSGTVTGTTNPSFNDTSDSSLVEDSTPPTGHSITSVVAHMSSCTVNWSSASDGAGCGLASLPYSVRYSTDSGFATAVTTTAWMSETSTQTLVIIPNTTYYFQVRARDIIGNESWSTTAATSTLCELPTTPTVSEVYLSSISVIIAPGNNPYYTKYAVKVTSGIIDQYLQANGSLNTSSEVYQTTESWKTSTAGDEGKLWITGLASNTTHQISARAQNSNQVNTVYSSAVTTSTLCNLPVLSSYNIYLGSITVNWAQNNPFGAQYYLERSTAANFTPAATSNWTTSISTDSYGLSINTTYYFRVKARNNSNIETLNYADFGSTSTLCEQPASPAISDVYPSSITFIITPGNNPAYTKYAVKVSSAGIEKYLQTSGGSLGDSEAFQTTDTWKASGTINKIWLTGLASNTTNIITVKAQNSNGVPTNYSTEASTVSLCNPAAAPTLSSVNPTTLKFIINENGNPAGTQWAVSISSDDYVFDVRYSSSDGSLVNSPVWQTKTGWHSAQGQNVGNLTSGLTYAVKTTARNYLAVETAFGPTGNIFLGAAVPGQPQLTVLSPTSIRCAINPVTNPSSTEYTVKVVDLLGGTTRYVKADYSLGDSEVWQTSSTWQTIDIVGLTANTLYSISNKARAGSETAYSTESSTYTSSAVPVTVSYSGVSNSAITTNWGKNGNPDYTEYAVWLSTDSNYGTYSSTITTNVNYEYTGLTANTTYYGKVRSRNVYGIESVWAELGSTTTLSSAIIALSPSNISTNSIQANWQSNDNPAGTQYLVQMSEDSGFTQGTGIGWLAQTNCTFGPSTSGSLTSNTTYYFRAKSRNAAARETGYVVLPATVTLAREPSSAVYNGILGHSINLSFTGNNPAGTEYNIMYSINSNYESPNYSTGWSTTTNYEFSNLSIDTEYYFRVRARNYAGVETGYASLGSTRTLADVTPPAVEVMTLPGSTAMPDGTLLGVTPGSNPGVRFSEAMTETSVEESGNVIIRATRDNLGNSIITEYPGVVDYNSATHQITYTPANPLPKGYVFELIVTTKVTDTALLPLQEEKKQKFSTVMDHARGNVYIAGDDFTKAEIPADTLGEDGYVGVSTDPARSCLPDNSNPAKSYDFTTPNNRLVTNNGLYGKPLTGTLREFGVYNTSGTRISGGFSAPITITLPYTDDDNDGIVDGSNPPVRAKTLRVYWLDETKNIWVKLPGSTVDTANKTVSVPVKHFSVYALAGSQDSEISGVYAYPVPYRPNSGNGASGTAVGGITFTSLPSEGEIKIYTLSGELVCELTFSGNVPTVNWDVKTSGGSEVASGVYIWRIKSGSDSKTGKLMIIK